VTTWNPVSRRGEGELRHRHHTRARGRHQDRPPRQVRRRPPAQSAALGQGKRGTQGIGKATHVTSSVHWFNMTIHFLAFSFLPSFFRQGDRRSRAGVMLPDRYVSPISNGGGFSSITNRTLLHLSSVQATVSSQATSAEATCCGASSAEPLAMPTPSPRTETKVMCAAVSLGLHAGAGRRFANKILSLPRPLGGRGQARDRADGRSVSGPLRQAARHSSPHRKRGTQRDRETTFLLLSFLERV
jgi:hypothetical protein